MASQVLFSAVLRDVEIGSTKALGYGAFGLRAWTYGVMVVSEYIERW